MCTYPMLRYILSIPVTRSHLVCIITFLLLNMYWDLDLSNECLFVFFPYGYFLILSVSVGVQVLLSNITDLLFNFVSGFIKSPFLVSKSLGQTILLKYQSPKDNCLYYTAEGLFSLSHF